MIGDIGDSVARLRDLAEANRMLNLAEEIAHVGHWRITLPSWRRTWSAETFRIFGIEPDGTTPTLMEAVNGYHPEDQDRVRDVIAAAEREPQDCTFEARVLRPTGEIRHVVIRLVCEVTDGAVRAFFGVIIDVTDQKRIEAVMRESEARYRLLAEHTTDMIVEADLDSTRRYVSPAARQMFGYEPEELIGTRAHEVLHPDDRDSFEEVLLTFRSGAADRATTRQRYKHKSGDYVWAETTYHVIIDPPTRRPSGYVAVIRDVTERHAAEMLAKHAAWHDPLTGLPNRTLFRHHLEEALSRARSGGNRFTLLWLDLDRFKSVNDTFGHPAGDRFLCEVAERLRSVVPSEDMLARIGGDEFAIILASGVSSEVRTIATRIIDAVDRPYELGDRHVRVGASMGIAIAPLHGSDADTLFKNADLALYRAKASGRKSFCFYEPDMDAAAADRLAIEVDLRAAIMAGSLTLHYQPIVSVASDTIMGCEALVRWWHPTRGAVPPSVIIPIAEESGLIVALGEWVLRESCRQAAAWPCELQVAVNVSVCQFRRPGFEQSVLSALTASGLPPARLELEITESVLIKDSEAVLGCLHRLRALGVKTSLDDFGTGFSSLSYIHRFPFDKIKIDQSFVQAMNDKGARAIVSLIADLGKRLGVIVTAEGVETMAQLREIEDAGCNQYQGYLFSHPLAAAEFESLLPKNVHAAASR